MQYLIAVLITIIGVGFYKMIEPTKEATAKQYKGLHKLVKELKKSGDILDIPKGLRGEIKNISTIRINQYEREELLSLIKQYLTRNSYYGHGRLSRYQFRKICSEIINVSNKPKEAESLIKEFA